MNMSMKASSSMLYWYPKVKDLPIMQPNTEMVLIDKKFNWIDWLEGNKKLRRNFTDRYMPEIINVARNIGYPLFLRGDHASGKHEWMNTCYVEKEEDIFCHIARVVEFNLCADIIGLPINALVFREYIKMDSRFTAFREMPVNSERRYFVKDGEVLCRHSYWVKEAIEQGYHTISLPKNWKTLLNKMNKESLGEVMLLTNYARLISSKIDGYWSVDFCKGKDDYWYFIDMALGKESWHPECLKKLMV